MIVPSPKARALKLSRHIDWKTKKVAIKERTVEWLDRLIELYSHDPKTKNWHEDTKTEYLKIK